MARERPYLFAMNGGEVSPRALGRVDLKRMAITAETMVNTIPRVIGQMQLRPGLGYLGMPPSQVKQIPFVFAADDTAMVELSNLALQVVVDDAPISRPAVSTVITNGDFSSAVGWTLTNTGGSVNAVPRSQIAGGVLTMNNWVRGGSMTVKRSTTVAAPDLNKEHALRIVVSRGPVKFRCGSTDGGDEYINETALGTGVYSLAFTPTASPFWVQFSSEVERDTIVDSIQIEGAGVMSLPAPWPTNDLRKCRHAQSGDVIFVANSSRLYQTRRIERRGPRSWGIALHENLDGPFRPQSSSAALSFVIPPAFGGGTVGLNATKPFFKPSHVGSLIRLFASQSVVVGEQSASNRWSDMIRITGNTAAERTMTWTTIGTWAGTLVAQLSYDEGLTWVTSSTSRTANGSANNLAFGAANQILHVRVGFPPGGFVSGTARNSMIYEGGGGWGVVRVVSVTSPTSATVDIIKPPLSYTDYAFTEWEEGQFSDLYGWPSSCEFFDGRFWLGDRDKINGSVSDGFDSLDVEVEGDSGPIIRSIATGPVNRALWMLGLGRLIVGTSGSEAVPRSTSFDEVMTPSNFSIKDASTYGSADVQAVKIDRSGVFIERSGKRAYLLAFSVDDQDYASSELTKYHPTILGSGNVSCIGLAVQRQPDTRVWFLLSDGTAVCLVYEPKEDVISWFRFETDGDIEDIAILPNAEASDVYMIVKRTLPVIGEVRYREKLAYDTDAEGGISNYIADSYWTQDLVAASTMTGGSHLAGKNVVLWINGSPILNPVDPNGNQTPKLFTVDALGQVALGQPYTGKAIAGLYYEGLWKSTKLAYAANSGSAVSVKKNVLGAQPILYKTHNRGIMFGQTFDKMTHLPLKYRMVDQTRDKLLEEWDDDQFSIPGAFSADSRMCVKMMAPMPATVLATVLKIEGHENG